MVVAGDDVAVGVGGVGPVDGAEFAAAVDERCRLDELGSADFLVALGRESGDDELAPVVVDEIAVVVFDDVSGGPAGVVWLRSRLRVDKVGNTAKGDQMRAPSARGLTTGNAVGFPAPCNTRPQRSGVDKPS